MLIPEEFHHKWLRYESSPVDWCEDNFTVSPYIAEFTNTISNIFLIFIPISLYYHGSWESYIRHVPIGSPKILMVMQTTVGIGSCWFHGSLSLLGQFADEMPILWLILTQYMIAIPNSFFANKVTRKLVDLVIVVYGLLVTVLWFYDHDMCQFWLWLMFIPLIFLFLFKGILNEDPGLKWISKVAVGLFSLSAAIWITDKFFCSNVKALGLPGIHNIFHITAALGANFAAPALGLITCQVDHPDLDVQIKYLYGFVPYLSCKGKAK